MSDNINENFFDSIGQVQDQTHVQQSEQQTHQIESDQTQSGHEPMSEDADLFDIKQRVKGMDEEAARLIQLQSEMEQQMKSTASPTASMGGPFGGFMTPEEKSEADARSIYVGNVDYSATAQELEAHFHGCGSINRVTILCDKFSGHPKGFAYVEFGDKDSVQTAMALDESLFKGRQIKVVSKRTNKPGISTTDRVPRGRGGIMHPTGFGYMGRGRGGVATGFGAPRGAFNPYMRSYRGRIVKGGRGGFAPYYAPY